MELGENMAIRQGIGRYREKQIWTGGSAIAMQRDTVGKLTIIHAPNTMRYGHYLPIPLEWLNCLTFLHSRLLPRLQVFDHEV